jgi:hypothetical protein
VVYSSCTPLFEIPLQKPILCAFSIVFITFLSLPVVAQGIKAAEPGSEYTVTAGSGPFHVDVHLRSTATQRLRVTVRYGRETTEGMQKGHPNPEIAFVCFGYTESGKQNATLECNPPLATPGGIYRGVGTVTVSRDETGASKEYTDIRLPMVTIEPNPLAISDFPDIVGTSLSLDNRQSLTDGSRKSQDVLNSLSVHIKPGTPNSKEVRAYLREVAEEERRVIDITRRRYIGDPANKKAPIFFEDFDRRLEVIIREMGGTPYPMVAKNRIAKAHFLLVQMPHASDSVTINENSPTTISRSLNDLVGVLTDAVKGLLGMSESGTTSFHWSATTIPQGADIYISRLDEPETKWVGATNVKDAMLENAIWTFRFDWNGCSKREKPNPFLQHTIDLKLTKEGCRRP